MWSAARVLAVVMGVSQTIIVSWAIMVHSAYYFGGEEFSIRQQQQQQVPDDVRKMTDKSQSWILPAITLAISIFKHVGTIVVLLIQFFSGITLILGSIQNDVNKVGIWCTVESVFFFLEVVGVVGAWIVLGLTADALDAILKLIFNLFFLKVVKSYKLMLELQNVNNGVNPPGRVGNVNHQD